MFEVWRQHREDVRKHRELEMLSKQARENLRRRLSSEHGAARFDTACELADAGDDDGSQLLGECLRGRFTSENNGHAHPDPNVAATKLGNLAGHGSAKALRELQIAVGHAPARTESERLARGYASRELRKLGYSPPPGSGERRGYLLSQGEFDDLAREYSDDDTIEALTIEAECGHVAAAWALGYFADELAVDSLVRLVAFTPSDFAPDVYSGDADRDERLRRCSRALSLTACDALYELSGVDWDGDMAAVAARVLASLDKAKREHRNGVDSPGYRCRRRDGRSITFENCGAAWRKHMQ